MTMKSLATNELVNPVAIWDKDLSRSGSFTLEAFELCTVCGARFGIGYQSEITPGDITVSDDDDLPKKLTEILAKDHRQNREHKHLIELDY